MPAADAVAGSEHGHGIAGYALEGASLGASGLCRLPLAVPVLFLRHGDLLVHIPGSCSGAAGPDLSPAGRLRSQLAPRRGRRSAGLMRAVRTALPWVCTTSTG